MVLHEGRIIIAASGLGSGYHPIIPKVVPMFMSPLSQLRSEIKIHSSLRHKYVVQFERFFEDTQNVYIILELCTQQVGPPLSSRVKAGTYMTVNLYPSTHPFCSGGGGEWRDTKFVVANFERKTDQILPSFFSGVGPKIPRK